MRLVLLLHVQECAEKTLGQFQCFRWAFHRAQGGHSSSLSDYRGNPQVEVPGTISIAVSSVMPDIPPLLVRVFTVAGQSFRAIARHTKKASPANSGCEATSALNPSINVSNVIGAIINKLMKLLYRLYVTEPVEVF